LEEGSESLVLMAQTNVVLEMENAVDVEAEVQPSNHGHLFST